LDFSFTGSSVTSLAPGATVLVVKNLAAFATRYPAVPAGRIAGQYRGSLENHGERLQLIDAAGGEVLDFRYGNQWYPITDGLGFSLVIVHEGAMPDAWSDPAQWHPSAYGSGSPAADDPLPPTLPRILITEILSRTDTPPPTDSIELYNSSASSADIG